MSALLEALRALQDETTRIVNAVSEQDYQQQFHPDLSPLGWHLGHCIFTESYWIQEQLLGMPLTNDSLRSLYVPELSKKQSRGSALPEKNELIEWANLTQAKNRSLLETAKNEFGSHPLLEEHYLYHFLIQHYAQHIETMYMVLTEIQRQTVEHASILGHIPTKHPKKEMPVTIEAGTCSIGSDDIHHYDNERPAQTIEMERFNIAVSPVTNGEFVDFINASAYVTRDYWSNAAWEWLINNKITHPHHWYRKNDDSWYGINHDGLYSLADDQPVHGINYYEAEAYANWASARLPSEHEWETACNKNHIKQTGLVWEWCGSAFQPYPGFSAYPYDGYSVPYFDGKHYVLKGGSCYTKDVIKRPSFRNYYTADKRHIFAGLRLVYD